MVRMSSGHVSATRHFILKFISKWNLLYCAQTATVIDFVFQSFLHKFAVVLSLLMVFSAHD